MRKGCCCKLTERVTSNYVPLITTPTVIFPLPIFFQEQHFTFPSIFLSLSLSECLATISQFLSPFHPSKRSEFELELHSESGRGRRAKKWKSELRRGWKMSLGWFCQRSFFTGHEWVDGMTMSTCSLEVVKVQFSSCVHGTKCLFFLLSSDLTRTWKTHLTSFPLCLLLSVSDHFYCFFSENFNVRKIDERKTKLPAINQLFLLLSFDEEKKKRAINTFL